MGSSNAPMLWRLRRPLQRAFAWIALATALLGLGLVLHGLTVGPIEELGPGLTLVVGGLLLFLFDRRRSRKQ